MFLGSLGTVTMDISYLQSFTKCIISSFKKYLESEHCVSLITLHAPSYHQLTPYFPVLVLLLLVTLSLPMSIVFVAYQEEILPRVQSLFLCLHSLMISHLIQSETLSPCLGCRSYGLPISCLTSLASPFVVCQSPEYCEQMFPSNFLTPLSGMLVLRSLHDVFPYFLQVFGHMSLFLVGPIFLQLL